MSYLMVLVPPSCRVLLLRMAWYRELMVDGLREGSVSESSGRSEPSSALTQSFRDQNPPDPS